MNDAMIFGKRLYLLRIKNFKSQAACAEKLGYSATMISSWERGKNLPTVLTLIDLANYFNVSADYLLGLSDKKEREK